MTINYSEKIKKIDNDRILMLNTVKENMTKNNMALFNNLNNVISTLNEDEMNTKKYKSIVKAKQFIFELTEQITNAASIEEITNLRKKINYYINKIKKELAERNINQELFDKMYDSVDYLRTDVARYISFLKREANLTEISKLYDNIDNLSPESITKLKKLLSNEVRYNKRYMTSINDYQKKCSKNVKNKLSTSKDTVINSDNVKNLFEKKEDVSSEVDLLNLPLDLFADFKDEDDFQLTHNNGLSKFQNLSIQIERYLCQYNFSDISSYDGNFLKKCIAFVKNIPRYMLNKKIIKFAERDYNVYYHGDDLAHFINYFKKYNSIQFAFELIFRKSSLSKREIECLFDHKKCVDWIMEFCSPQNRILETNKKLFRSRNYI